MRVIGNRLGCRIHISTGEFILQSGTNIALAHLHLRTKSAQRSTAGKKRPPLTKCAGKSQLQAVLKMLVELGLV